MVYIRVEIIHIAVVAIAIVLNVHEGIYVMFALKDIFPIIMIIAINAM